MYVKRRAKLSNSPIAIAVSINRVAIIKNPAFGVTRLSQNRNQAGEEARLTIGHILQIPDVVCGKSRLPFQIGVDRYDGPKRDAHAGRCHDKPCQRTLFRRFRFHNQITRGKDAFLYQVLSTCSRTTALLCSVPRIENKRNCSFGRFASDQTHLLARSRLAALLGDSRVE